MNYLELEIPSSWTTCSISDVAEVGLGKTPRKKDYANNGKNKIIKFRDVRHEGVNWDKDDKGFVLENATSDLRKLEENDVLITASAHASEHIGKKLAFVSSIPSIFEQVFYVGELLCIRCIESALHPSLAFYYFMSRMGYKTIQYHVKGVHLTSGEARKIQIPLPPIYEQHRIVAKIEELFSELDKGIESLKTAREQVKVYRQALLKHAFEGKLTEQWRKDRTDALHGSASVAGGQEPGASKLETADQLLERIKQEREARYQQQLEEWKAAIKHWKESGKGGKKPPRPRNLPTVKPENEGTPIEGLPKSWHCLKLLDIILSLGQGWSPKCNNIPAGYSEWGVIKTTAIQHLNYLEAENKQLPAELVPRPWLSIQQDDILITRAGPRSRVGVVCRVSETRDKLILCDKAYRMQFPESEISPVYVETLLNTEDFKRKIESLKTGINDSGVNITQPRLLGLYFPVPPIEEQLEIGRLLDERLSVLERNISDIDEVLEKSEALRQSILKKAFSGQLVTQEPDDEPASVLLERIAKEKEEAAAKAKKAKAATKKQVTRKAC